VSCGNGQKIKYKRAEMRPSASANSKISSLGRKLQSGVAKTATTPVLHCTPLGQSRDKRVESNEQDVGDQGECT
jgi:hypothetical protein